MLYTRLNKLAFLACFLASTAVLCAAKIKKSEIQASVPGTSTESNERFFYLGQKYGKFCGAGNTQYSRRGSVCGRDRNGVRRCGYPKDDMDRACFYHDLCHVGNFDTSSSNCRCASKFYDAVLDIDDNCGWSWSQKCRYARNAVIYAGSLYSYVC